MGAHIYVLCEAILLLLLPFPYPCGLGTRLGLVMQELDLGTHGLNTELGRHRGREGKSECVLCGVECESVVHVLCHGSVQAIVILEASLWRSFGSF